MSTGPSTESDPASPAELTVRDDELKSQYEITADDRAVGFARYRLHPGTIAFTHTEVDPRFQGHGAAGRLIGFALDDAAGRGLDVLPYCPFVRGYIAHHQEYLRLVPNQRRHEFEL